MNLKLLLIFLLLVGAIFCNSTTIPNHKKIYIIWCSVVMLLSISLKSAYYGTFYDNGADTLSYIQSYKSASEYTFGDIWRRFLERYIYRTGEEDIGYLLLTWLFSQITSSYHIFSTFVDLLFFIPFAKLVDRYCNKLIEIFFAYLLYLALFHTFAMYGARQFYALGFGIMFFLFYTDKKYKEAVVCLLVGMTLHLSLLLVLIPFAISFLSGKSVRALHILSLVMTPVSFLTANRVVYFMGNAVGIEKYASYGLGELRGGAATYIILSELLSFIFLLLARTRELEDKKIKYVYAMIPAFTFFAPLINSNGSMMRITIYSQIYATVLMPVLLDNRFGKKGKQYLLIAIIVLMFLMLKGSYQPYYFFWQVDPPALW